MYDEKGETLITKVSSPGTSTKTVLQWLHFCRFQWRFEECVYGWWWRDIGCDDTSTREILYQLSIGLMKNELRGDSLKHKRYWRWNIVWLFYGQVNVKASLGSWNNGGLSDSLKVNDNIFWVKKAMKIYCLFFVNPSIFNDVAVWLQSSASDFSVNPISEFCDVSINSWYSFFATTWEKFKIILKLHKS